MTHGMSGTREYMRWVNMKTRCLNRKDWRYPLYGGRGITICPEWVVSFERFHRDMGPCPVGCSLERKDVNGNYEPSNCEWADKVKQANNRRRNILVEYRGKRQTLPMWAREFNISLGVLWYRYRKQFPVDQLFSTDNFLKTQRVGGPLLGRKDLQ